MEIKRNDGKLNICEWHCWVWTYKSQYAWHLRKIKNENGRKVVNFVASIDLLTCINKWIRLLTIKETYNVKGKNDEKPFFNKIETRTNEISKRTKPHYIYVNIDCKQISQNRNYRQQQQKRAEWMRQSSKKKKSSSDASVLKMITHMYTSFGLPAQVSE